MSIVTDLLAALFDPAMLLTIFGMLLLLVANEWWWHGKTHGELSRKFVHITIGIFVASWPWFLDWTQIELLSLAFVVSVLVSQYFGVFKAIHSAQRPTWGEIFFGLAVGVVALMTNQPAIFAVAILHMGVADGLAAVIGTKYGGRNRYTVFGMYKSVVGTLAFATVSAIILLGFALQQGVGLHVWLPLIIVVSTLLENLAIKGLDNLLVPLFVAFVLGLVL